MSHTIVAGDLISVDFDITNTGGESADADALPTSVLVINGVDNAAVVTVVNKSTGIYNASVTLPSTLVAGNAIQLRISATVNAEVSKGIIYTEVIGHAYPGLNLLLDFICQTNVGVAKDADTTPTSVFARNAVDDPAVITVVNKETGVYTLQGNIPPAFKAGDEMQVRVETTVDGILGKNNVFLETLVSEPVTTAAVVYSYADLVYADDYFTRRLYVQAWTEANDAQRTAALQEAAQRMDRLNFRGARTVSTQILEWPRINTSFDDDVIPNDIKIANCEVAFALLDGVDPDMEYENLAAVAEGASSMRTTYGRTLVPEHFSAGIPSHLAWLHLRPHLADVRRVKLRRV